MKPTTAFFEPNERAGGKGRIAPLFHVEYLWQALPQYGRYAE